ncbi:nitroreductase family protein [Komagataeibacter sp. AV436]|uniref:Nitroreductase family protein n=1 Tax=Komagataeibacter melomenusus TaxID=2766578 RepID=A0ABX2AAQ9_9PROT|nr:nitroreductase family protein [Komagataeibacter melomenusus]MBV1829850.1 nitroreductase family protein [Komagataeibacter melomenusus]NPC65338.1 nitroreductase family protein [Komagataeibacter melomenusus]
MTKAPERQSDTPVARLILDRWSPRAFTPAPIAEAELLALLDAGRWAPSAYNSQPWRFIYARRDTPEWERFLSWLIPFNHGWAQHASALVYVASHTVMSGRAEPVPAPTHAFDAGAAAVLIQLQASTAGWAAHPVSGFDQERARAGLELPEDYALNAAIVIGRQGEAKSLPESLQEREKPSGRRPLHQLAFQGRFTPGQQEQDGA